MPRDTLDIEFSKIQDELLALGSMVEQAILDSVVALKNRDEQASHKIIDFDQEINDKRYAIENAIIIVMATQQPFAHDLRRLTAILIVANELERMGDYAKGIAKTNLRLGVSEVPIPMKEIDQMAKIGVDMLHRALTSFVKEDTKQAIAIPKEDNQVDDLFNKAYKIIIDIMIANKAVIDQANLILWVVHNLERFSDRVTNICERTIFIATGESLEFDTSEDEDEAGIEEVF
jgi:phosphate transport system protein